MKQWIRKIAVIMVAIMTLGTYIPVAHLNTDAEENKESVSPESDINDVVSVADSQIIDDSETDLTLENIDYTETYINDLTEKAKEQTITKLGPRIATQVDDDFMTEILPKIEESLNVILAGSEEEVLPYYSITERPSDGLGEKIFNIYDNRTNKDIARFHVRRDNRPLEGYWFNFHYHLSSDGFENHHEIGEIYWDKNIPPKWMA
ncbi:YpjP family protein [Virgibacillus doumboii]|uniref:YpjP family protein n=1 Tax=Virgibacillus doumboii TaxID=2697503 RepID=UPI0013DF5592|nr:YpjP family protein [Virgibacillus doumboii]